MPVMRQGCLSLAGLINPTFSSRIIAGHGAAQPCSRAREERCRSERLLSADPSRSPALPPSPLPPPRHAPHARLQFITLVSRVE